jgi:16S rRNA (cytosine1402-N4)-methyltransferase
MEIVHIPVMLEEVVEALKIKNSGVYVDATLGLGGHAEGILQKTRKCMIIGIDRDSEALEVAKKRLKDYPNIQFVKNNFSNIKAVVNRLGYERVDGILFDLGVSTLQLKSEGRGFSFLKDEPLDMRMDRTQRLTAEEIVNGYSEKALATVIWQYGEERYSKRIARAIINARRKRPIKSCRELATIIEKAVGKRGRIHPATRTFQALRIKVNEELKELSTAIDTGAEILESGGRMCVLSYHSLEDRIVKRGFKRLVEDGLFKIITKKPMVPNPQERALNPSSRSAKLRIAERL